MEHAPKDGTPAEGKQRQEAAGYRPGPGAALLFALIVVAAAAFLISRGGIGGSARPDCGSLAPQIIQLSERNAGTLRPTILKLYEVEMVSETDSTVQCRADALLSTNVRAPIDFYWWLDDDGDPFIRYQDAEQQ